MARQFIQRSRHGTVYYFRRRVPIDLQSSVGKPQVMLSLGTHDLHTAKALARHVAVQLDDVFAIIRAMDKKPTKGQIDLATLITIRKNESRLRERIDELEDLVAGAKQEGFKRLNCPNSAIL